MRRAIIIVALALASVAAHAQEWVEYDGTEYNCAVLSDILEEYANEPLTRLSGVERSVSSYFEQIYSNCDIDSTESSTDETEQVEIDDANVHIATPTPTPDNQENCYPYKMVTIANDARIYMIPRRNMEHYNRVVYAGDQYEVIQSQMSQGLCWLEITTLPPGWLRHDQIASQAERISVTADWCYLHRMAYITGTMNIREQATANSKRVGTAQARDSFKVTHSEQGDTWCWLKISKGWLANTEFVSHDIIDILPPVEGDEWFVRKVVAAFNFLSEKSPIWFEYTVPMFRSIKDDPQLDSAARVLVQSRQVSLAGDYLRSRGTADFASTLIHEACHVHQWEEGKRSILGWDLEKECYALEARALSQLSPGSRDRIKWLQCMAENYPIESLCTPFWIELQDG